MVKNGFLATKTDKYVIVNFSDDELTSIARKHSNDYVFLQKKAHYNHYLKEWKIETSEKFYIKNGDDIKFIGDSVSRVSIFLENIHKDESVEAELEYDKIAEEYNNGLKDIRKVLDFNSFKRAII